jgi:hypothetical protein
LAEVLVYVLDGQAADGVGPPTSPQLAWESDDLFALPSPHDRVWLHADASHAAALLVFDNAPLLRTLFGGSGDGVPGDATVFFPPAGGEGLLVKP